MSDINDNSISFKQQIKDYQYKQSQKYQLYKKSESSSISSSTIPNDTTSSNLMCNDVGAHNQDNCLITPQKRTLNNTASTNPTKKKQRKIVPHREECVPAPTVVTWNIDGLCERYLTLRTLAVVDIILDKQPHAVLLQEVITESEKIISRALSSTYHIVTPAKCCVKLPDPLGFGSPGYYCITLLHKTYLAIKGEPEVYWFPNSVMGRHIILIRANYLNMSDCLEIIILNSHMESCKEYAAERIAQLSYAFDLIKKVHHSNDVCNPLIMFGGDMNCRDNEVKTVACDNIKDMWEILGCPKSCQFTWDTSKNFNTNITSKYRPKMRFDRMYMYYEKPPSQGSSESVQNMEWVPKQVEFVGTNIMQSINLHPSDHFGLMFSLQLSI